MHSFLSTIQEEDLSAENGTVSTSAPHDMTITINEYSVSRSSSGSPVGFRLATIIEMDESSEDDEYLNAVSSDFYGTKKNMDLHVVLFRKMGLSGKDLGYIEKRENEKALFVKLYNECRNNNEIDEDDLVERAKQFLVDRIGELRLGNVDCHASTQFFKYFMLMDMIEIPLAHLHYLLFLDTYRYTPDFYVLEDVYLRLVRA